MAGVAPGRVAATWPAHWILLVFLAALTGGLPTVAAETAVDYLRDIKPLLRERCYSCHGVLKQKSDLRLDTVELMLKGGKSGPVVVRKDAAGSLIVRRVTAAQLDERMPPEHEGEPFSSVQVQRLQDWIQAGAPAPATELPEVDPKDHWAFRPRQRPPLPTIRQASWPRGAIDWFVAHERERAELTPAGEASREALIRRLFFDLVGLPPTGRELFELTEDRSPDWYERLVDRLLDDPRHGERWARHWMDIWRYSDWWGLGDQLRNSQKHMWHWRDWIVESLNANLPYDEMIRLMLAADESHPNDLSRLRASGFLARNYFLFNRNQWMEETVEHVSKAFLGLTMNCAKCHDHKYDPIAQVDFYRLRAFFEPYHVRLDVLPGEADLAQNGLPRAFDGLLDVPTYRFVRGQEKDPDKSVAISPGVPELFAFTPPPFHPVELPDEAVHPEYRPWVAEAAIRAARQKLDQARQTRDRGAARPETNQGVGEASQRAQAERKVAEAAVGAAEAEFDSLFKRVAALRAERDHATSSDPDRRAAIESERANAVAQGKHKLALAEERLLKGEAAKREALEKDVKTARTELEAAEKARTAAVKPEESYSRIVGAAWTPTRFLDSTKDDPKVAFPARSTGRRSALAHWITDARHPLTARVAVNHLWMRHFGTALVPTVFDFGRKGGIPIHRDLVDWLASEFVDSGWDLKHLHRLIVTSATYRMSSSTANLSTNLEKDPDNLRWWRRLPVRLESQAVRDSILLQAGALDATLGGPSVPAAEQPTSRRRSLYFFHSNNDQNLFLTTFDDATVKECYRREQSIVPQQALALANSQLVHDNLPLIAARLQAECSRTAPGTEVTDPTFIRHAFQILLGITPSPAESAAAEQALQAWRHGAGEGGQGSNGGSARMNLVWALLNHNDFVTLR